MTGKRIISCMVCALIIYAAPTAMYSKSSTIQESSPPAKHFPDVRLPRGYRLPPVQTRQLKGKGLVVDLFAVNFSQGMAVYAELYADTAENEKALKVEKLLYDGAEIRLSRKKWGWRALFGLNPDSAPGIKKLQVQYTIAGKRQTEAFSVLVAVSVFRVYPGALDLGKYSDVDYKHTPEEERFINECAIKKKKAFGHVGSDELNSALSHPRDYHFVTSPFYAKRNILQYRKIKHRKVRCKNKLNIHRGIDLRGKTGEPVFAMARGKIVIAEKMYYEGNFIVIDHGNGIFSCYMHLDKVNVRAGDPVNAGESIGRVGSTGLSTASHLHASFFLQDVSVDPLSMLVLPVRD
jgi:murein DD-endopeptidase